MLEEVNGNNDDGMRCQQDAGQQLRMKGEVGIEGGEFSAFPLAQLPSSLASNLDIDGGAGGLFFSSYTDLTPMQVVGGGSGSKATGR